MRRLSRRHRMAGRFENSARFLTYLFASLVLSLRLCVNVCFSRKVAKREKPKTRRAVAVLEPLSLCRLFILSFALLTNGLSTDAQSSPSASNQAPLRVIAADYLRVKGKHDTFFQQ